MDRRPLVHIDMFKPNEGGRMAFDGLIHKMVGEPANELTRGISEGRFTRFSVPPDLKDAINLRFYNSLPYLTGIAGDVNMQRFWAARVEDAIAVHQEVKAKFPNMDMDILTEVSNPTSDISDTLAVLSAKGHNSLPGHERKARMLMGLISTEIVAGDMKQDMSTELARVEAVLLERYFADEDNTHPYRLHTMHDKTTNSYLPARHDAETGEVSNKGVSKSFSVQVRQVKGGGPVHFFTGLKPRTSGVTKAIDRAVRNGGEVNPHEDVTDRYRVALASMDERVDGEGVAKRIRALLSDNYRDIVRFKADSATDGYKDDGASNRLGWYREKIWFEGVTTPLELVVFDRASFVNYKVEVGRRDPNTGLFNGNARDLYVPYRMEGLLRVIYPSEAMIYRIDPRRAVAERMAELVPSIKAKGKPLKVRNDKYLAYELHGLK